MGLSLDFQVSGGKYLFCCNIYRNLATNTKPYEVKKTRKKMLSAIKYVFFLKHISTHKLQKHNQNLQNYKYYSVYFSKEKYILFFISEKILQMVFRLDGCSESPALWRSHFGNLKTMVLRICSFSSTGSVAEPMSFDHFPSDLTEFSLPILFHSVII